MIDVDMCISIHLKEELAWVVDTIMFKNSKTTKELKGTSHFNLKQYCMRCYVGLSNVRGG